MPLSSVYKSYFQGFQELRNFTKNKPTTNILALLKIASYFTVVAPICLSILYGAASLYGRVSKKQTYSAQEENIHNRADSVLNINSERGQGDYPAVYAAQSLEGISSVSTSSLDGKLHPITFEEVLKMYNPACYPSLNLNNLKQYAESDDYKRHAQTARIYYNANQLEAKDALKVIFQREPTNIGMQEGQYDKEATKNLLGYTEGVYNDKSAKKVNGSSFSELPNTAAVYSETYLWDPPGGNNKKEIACLSLPAPALDTPRQPHYAYYTQNDQLDRKKYLEEIKFLFQVIEKVVRDNKDSAFNNKGIQRIVLSKFGQGAFLKALSLVDQKAANVLYKTQMNRFIKNVKDTNIKIVMSEFRGEAWHTEMIFGDIIQTAEERDLIVNAWDPHSAPGNGNDVDRSFDGAMGKASGILLTQTSWLNERLKSPDALVAV